MTNIVCESRNKSWVLFDNCLLNATKKNRMILNVALTFLHPTNSVTLRIQVLKKVKIYKPWLMYSGWLQVYAGQKQQDNQGILGYYQGLFQL